jgi:hypothetical protein
MEKFSSTLRQNACQHEPDMTKLRYHKHGRVTVCTKCGIKLFLHRVVREPANAPKN